MAPAVKRTDRRHRARETALQILYQWEIGRADIERVIDTVLDLQWPHPTPPDASLRQFASGLARDTVARLGDIDPLIAATTERWRPERMALLDRLILRLATCEMLRDPATPRPVVINEALELARTYSTDDSVRFINGMLDAIRKKLDQESH